MAVGCASLAPQTARAGDWDLDDEPSAAPSKSDEASKFDAFANAPQAKATIGARTYDLETCLALADRNYPNLWAARARLGFVHGQLEEAKWLPWSQWHLNAGGGLLPPIYGSVFYTNTDLSIRNLGVLTGMGLSPTFRMSIDGLIPLYTFGKIDQARKTAEAGVRASEWELEKLRQQVRMDVRRAYYGVMMARDARYLIDEVSRRLDQALQDLKAKPEFDEIEQLRVGMYRDQVSVRRSEAEKGERYGMAALRFLTGVQTGFEVPEQTLTAPDVPIAPLVRYLAAARLFRPEVNMARAGVAARRAWLGYQRARYYPDIGLGLNAFYNVAPSAERQTNPWSGDPFNGFGFAVFVGARYPLDFLVQGARVQQAEAQVQEANALQRLALGGIAVEVENQYGIVVDAKNRVDRWSHAVRTARRWIVMIQDGIDLGTRDVRGLMEPMRYYVDSRSQELLAMHDLNVQMSELARVTGWDAAGPNGK